ncbi:hypothetical protein AJ87_14980 [Rhizobium yanglingense]|nr:hypothetical protein AJ87_14980 [Rhizobium yanglingense]
MQLSAVREMALKVKRLKVHPFKPCNQPALISLRNDISFVSKAVGQSRPPEEVQGTPMDLPLIARLGGIHR